MFHSLICQAIDAWYDKDSADPSGDAKCEGKNWKKMWTLRKVVVMKMRDEIDTRIDAPPGSLQYIRCYGRSLRRVMKGLTDEKREEFLELAEQWNQEGPPRDIQIRYIYQLQSHQVALTRGPS